MKKTKFVIIGLMFLAAMSMVSAQEVQEGDVIWEHDFSDGMPSEFQRNAGYNSETGTWGCEWSGSCDDGSQTDTGGAYEPASIQGNYLRVLGKSNSGRGVAFPTHLENDRNNIDNWVFTYRVDPFTDPDTSTTSHRNRDTAGFRTSPNWYDEHNQPDGRPGVNWRDEGDTIIIHDGQDFDEFSSNMDARNGEYHVKVAALSDETLVKYWEVGNSEPGTWQHQSSRTLDGVPAFYSVAAFHSDRYNDYRYYELREVSDNSGPETPTNPVPSNNAENVELSPSLEVDVSDPDGDSMDVTFYDASDDSVIGTDNSVVSGGTATVQTSNFDQTGTTYSWYAVADDGSTTTQSSTWSFTTEGEPQIDEASASPQEGSVVSTTPDLSVDVSHPDGRTMDVTFFLNGEAFGTDQQVDGSGTASIQTPDLNASEIYDWYVVVDDRNGYTVDNSGSPWSFETDSGEPNISVDYGNNTNFNPDRAVIDVVPGHSHADTVDYVRLLDGSSTVIDEVQNVQVGQPVSLLWEDLNEDQSYDFRAEIEHQGETSQTSLMSFTALTVGINLAASVNNAESYSIYRRAGTSGDQASFDYGDGDYRFIGSSSSLTLTDATSDLEVGDYCYVATASNVGGESPSSAEACITGVQVNP